MFPQVVGMIDLMHDNIQNKEQNGSGGKENTLI